MNLSLGQNESNSWFVFLSKATGCFCSPGTAPPSETGKRPGEAEAGACRHYHGCWEDGNLHSALGPGQPAVHLQEPERWLSDIRQSVLEALQSH